MTGETLPNGESRSKPPQSKIVESHLPCPKCDSSDAYSIATDGHGYCFSCGSYVPATETEETEEENTTELVSYEYLPWRGISRDTARFYDVQTKVLEDGKPHTILFPYTESTKFRLVDEKRIWSKGPIAKAGLFGKDKFSAGSSKAITVTEGEPDTLSVYQMLGSKYPSVGVQSASTAKRDCTVDYDYLNAFERIYICFDNDDPGRKAAKAVAELFDYQKVYFVKLTLKDPTDYLQAGRINEFRNIWYNSRRYLPDNVISALTDFKSIVTEESKGRGLEFPYVCLNNKTYGLRTGEVTLVTAPSGVGKTEFVRGIEYKILKETDENLAVIHLEENKTRTLKGFVGLELGYPVHLPDCNATPEELTAALDKLVKRDDRLYVYSHFGSDDPDIILNSVRFLVAAAKCRYVVFDHITMVTSGSGENERVALDQLSTKLRMLVDELDFALLLVSHVNKEGGTRGSANIVNIADTWIDLSRDLEAANEAQRNTTDVTLKKNRFYGETGPAGKLTFQRDTFKLVDTF